MELAWGTILRGWALAEQRRREEGTEQMRRELATWQAAGIEVFRPWWLAFLAETYGRGGQAEDGLSVLAEALAIVEKTGECFYEAELYRLKGELLRQTAKTKAEAEECFRKAITIARRQGTRSWELRAVTSLARLWRQQGKREEARQKLAEIYGWFTEGFDTKDLQEAKALLEQLT